ncbi:hypothetical protein BU26DRAFT_565530 [Trematosphaeria pertusa]|uniref:Uncharacterized protein n=1 Tax=Trematosphaeria pertusa TaxID=390896 RepID=A0A6A6ICH7_9PLEO|nr:uncharacterized protein BU26DRAFT_565530 [Trematosphaeria pertusa]KAF2248116.1 hypothetical protein BU26DRAFT_565530 [Trematosphaeria pertusa]
MAQTSNRNGSAHVNGPNGSKAPRRHRLRLYPPRENPPIPPAEVANVHAGSVPELDLEEVMKRVREHENHTIPVDFDTIAQYGVSSSPAKTLWEKEAKRLIELIRNPNQPLLYEDKTYGSISVENLEKISEIGQKLTWNLMICQLDNSLIVLQFQKRFFNERIFSRAYSALERGIDRTPEVLNVKNVPQCHAMINLMTGTLARLTVQAVDNHNWHSRCVAALAKIATKLKVLCQDPKGFAIRSVSNARDVEAKEEAKIFLGLKPGVVDPGEQETTEDIASAEPKDPGKSRNRLQEFGRFLAAREDDSTAAYIIEMLIPRDAIFSMASLLVSNLTESSHSGLSVGAFEISTLVYKTGFERSAVVLTQDRDGEMIASSSRQILRNTLTAFKNLEETLMAVKGELPPSVPPPPNRDQNQERQSPKDAVVEVMWEWVGTGKLASAPATKLTDTNHVVSLLLPACATHPKMGGTLVQLNRICNLTTSGEALRAVPEPDYTVIFTIKTKAYDKENKAAASSDEVRPISSSLMARHGLFALAEGIDVSRKDQQEEWHRKDVREKLAQIESRRNKLRELNKEIENEWQIDERAIVIGCRKYASWVAALCTLLVGGGLAIGFSIGRRLEGVDPFNITVFCWALAAFLLVIAKSFRVQDWPWRDFLHGRVVCRSLTELCSVTRKAPQDVLAWLLQNERSTVLETRGPYNKLFRRRGDEGFSIDCTIELSTMMLSGIIVVEVQTQLGPALVCLNVRPGVEYQAFVHSHEEDEEEWNLACIEPPSKNEPGAVATLLPMHIGWYKVLGVYNVPKRQFR